MKTITLLNEKGGVGKTTLANHLAWGLAARGKRVLLVDGDPQGHATIRAGLKKGPGLYDLLVRDGEWKATARLVAPERYGVPGERIPQGKLYVLPSNVETRNIANSISDAERLAVRLMEMQPFVDYVVIDSSPTPSLLHGVFYTATDAVLYPTQLAMGSFDGLVESIHRRTAADAVRSNHWSLPAIEVLGIVPTMYRSVTGEQRDNLNKLKAQFGALVWNEIPQATIWTESESYMRPVFALSPSSAAAGHVWEMIDKVEARYSNGV